MKTVVAADEFGAASEGDVGEFLKFLPGISMEYLAGDARQVSLGGVDFNYTPITFGGFGMTNGNQGGTNRGVSLEYMSLNNVSRVEVINSPTPESPGLALAGSINFVPRTAFERSKPQFTFSAYVSDAGRPARFPQERRAARTATRKVRPGVEFSYVVPVNSASASAFPARRSAYSARDSLVNIVARRQRRRPTAARFPTPRRDRPVPFELHCPRRLPDAEAFVDLADGSTTSSAATTGFVFDHALELQHQLRHSRPHFAIDAVQPGGFGPDVHPAARRRAAR